MDYIEVTAKTVSEAITKACLDLKLPSDRLDIKVISEGSKGFLGIGNKPAVIRVAPKAEETIEETVETVKKTEEKPVKKAVEKKEVSKAFVESKKEASEKEVKPAEEEPREARIYEKKERKDSFKKSHSKASHNKNKDFKVPEKAEENEAKPYVKEIEPVFKTDEEIAELKTVAEGFLSEVFQAMGVEVQMNFKYVPEMACLEIDFVGEDMGVLIGKRGQTLDSLQYLTSLVVNKTQKEYIRVKLDTEDYRKRRKETLEHLAKNIAYKVRKTRRPVVLEAMNPFERRIIHAALQPNKYVDTYSEGKEPYRHIVVVPKRNN